MEVLRRDTLKQCKEEVSIQVRGEKGGGGGDTRRNPPIQGPLTLSALYPQRQVRHPFVHGLGDSWQGQRHLFISE